MQQVALNLFLALLWVLTIGSFSLLNFIIGFVLGHIVLIVSTPKERQGPFFRWPTRGLLLLVYFLGELVAANLRVAYYTLSPMRRLRPTIVGIDIEGMSDLEITALSSLVALTPATLPLDVSADRRTLYVHFMHAASEEEARRDIEEGFRRRLLEVTR